LYDANDATGICRRDAVGWVSGASDGAATLGCKFSSKLAGSWRVAIIIAILCLRRFGVPLKELGRSMTMSVITEYGCIVHYFAVRGTALG